MTTVIQHTSAFSPHESQYLLNKETVTMSSQQITKINVPAVCSTVVKPTILTSIGTKADLSVASYIYTYCNRLRKVHLKICVENVFTDFYWSLPSALNTDITGYLFTHSLMLTTQIEAIHMITTVSMDYSWITWARSEYTYTKPNLIMEHVWYQHVLMCIWVAIANI